MSDCIDVTCSYQPPNALLWNCREWCQVFLKAAQLAEAMQTQAASDQADNHSISPDSDLGMTHGMQHALSSY